MLVHSITKFITKQQGVDTPIMLYKSGIGEVNLNLSYIPKSSYFNWAKRSLSSGTVVCAHNLTLDYIIRLMLNFKSSVKYIVSFREMYSSGYNYTEPNIKLMRDHAATTILILDTQQFDILQNIINNFLAMIEKRADIDNFTDQDTIVKSICTNYRSITKYLISQVNPLAAEDIAILYIVLKTLQASGYCQLSSNYPETLMDKNIYINYGLNTLFGHNNMHKAQVAYGQYLWPKMSNLPLENLLGTFTIDKNQQRWLNYVK